MRTTLIAGIAALVLIIGAIWLLLAHSGTQSPPSQTATSTSVFPVSGTNPGTGGTGGTGTGGQTGGTMTVASTNGSDVTTRNFLSDSGVVANPSKNSGYYVLTGYIPPGGTIPPYEIDYNSTDRSFGITLYQEPLGQERTAAQNDLMARLGLTQAQMCSLNYVVATGPGVNAIYQGKNLEFSFCSGATPLP